MFARKRLAFGVLGVLSALALAACDAGVTEPVSAGPERPLLARKPKKTEPAPEPTPDPDPTPPPTGTTPAFADGFESGARAAAQNGYGWTFAQAGGGGDAVSVSNTIARTGSYSLRFTYGGNPDLCDDAFSEQRFALGEDLKEVWFEYYLYFPSGGTTAGPKFYHRAVCATANDPRALDTNNKFFALWDVDYRARNVAFVMEYRRTTTGSDGDSYLYNLWGGASVVQHSSTEGVGQWNGFMTDANRGRWVQVRIHARISDSADPAKANGLVEVWFDGVKRINESGIPLMSTNSAGNFFRNGYLMGWSNSGFDQTTSVYLDDFKIFRSSPGW
ncbi:MAG TPA: heparin lyase I family protein [Longimicrobiaceae bacterium]|nr:heparin lyase I family protein [Longimicrobiaceae bacterium]